MAPAAPALAQTPPVPVALTHADIAYAPAEPAKGRGHKLDLFLNVTASGGGRPPLVIYTGGSGWMADNGKEAAKLVAGPLNTAGFAVAGVSIRASHQVQFPGQLHDIKAAIRWLRANAGTYGYDPDRIAIMGDSSGGWTSAMVAVTGDVPELEGVVGKTGPSSAVQAAVAFYPPTRFLMMDSWAAKPCNPGQAGIAPGFCHDGADSPESRLIGCPIQSCPDKAEKADPVRYVSPRDPPIMILHGGSDPLVPHSQGEWLYQALNKQCLDAVFVSLPTAGHGPVFRILSDDKVRVAATMRSTERAGCTVRDPQPFTPDWGSIIAFLKRSLSQR